MTRHSFSTPFLTGAMLLLQSVSAAPTPDPIDSLTNVKFVGCDGPINGVADPLSIMKKAFDDVFTLAEVAFDGLNKTIAQADSIPLSYQHYFNNTEMTQALNMYSVIKDHPVSADWDLVVNCTKVAACDAQYYAVTGPTNDDPATNVIHVCPLFFNTSMVTTRTLPDQTGLGTFCNATTLANGTRESANYRTYSTAGQIFLGEMTHLTAVGKAAGLPPQFPSSNFTGTSRAFYTLETFDASLWTARHLRDLLSEDPINTNPPIRNSKSYALAATEQWVTQNCNFSYIDPQFGAGIYSANSSFDQQVHID